MGVSDILAVARQIGEADPAALSKTILRPVGSRVAGALSEVSDADLATSVMLLGHRAFTAEEKQAVVNEVHSRADRLTGDVLLTTAEALAQRNRQFVTDAARDALAARLLEEKPGSAVRCGRAAAMLGGDREQCGQLLQSVSVESLPEKELLLIPSAMGAADVPDVEMFRKASRRFLSIIDNLEAHEVATYLLSCRQLSLEDDGSAVQWDEVLGDELWTQVETMSNAKILKLAAGLANPRHIPASGGRVSQLGKTFATKVEPLLERMKTEEKLQLCVYVGQISLAKGTDVSAYITAVSEAVQGSADAEALTTAALAVAKLSSKAAGEGTAMLGIAKAVEAVDATQLSPKAVGRIADAIRAMSTMPVTVVTIFVRVLVARLKAGEKLPVGTRAALLSKTHLPLRSSGMAPEFCEMLLLTCESLVGEDISDPVKERLLEIGSTLLDTVPYGSPSRARTEKLLADVASQYPAAFGTVPLRFLTTDIVDVLPEGAAAARTAAVQRAGVEA